MTFSFPDEHLQEQVPVPLRPHAHDRHQSLRLASRPDFGDASRDCRACRQKLLDK